MCELSSLMAIMGAVTSGLQVVGHNRALAAQAQATNETAQRFHAENASRAFQERFNAHQDAYISALETDRAAGRAIVRNTALGIGGNTAREMVAQEVRSGSHNVRSAQETMRDSYASQLIGDAHTTAEARTRNRALESRMYSPVAGLFATATGGLRGYMSGRQMTEHFGTATPWRR